MRVLLAVNDVLLLPCVYFTIHKTLSYFWDIERIWTSRSFVWAALPVVFLNCFFYFPYIASTGIMACYVLVLHKHGFPKKDTAIFICLALICVLGLISLDTVFRGVMSV